VVHRIQLQLVVVEVVLVITQAQALVEQVALVA
jgi:hypothetical protein